MGPFVSDLLPEVRRLGVKHFYFWTLLDDYWNADTMHIDFDREKM